MGVPDVARVWQVEDKVFFENGREKEKYMHVANPVLLGGSAGSIYMPPPPSGVARVTGARGKLKFCVPPPKKKTPKNKNKMPCIQSYRRSQGYMYNLRLFT